MYSDLPEPVRPDAIPAGHEAPEVATPADLEVVRRSSEAVKYPVIEETEVSLVAASDENRIFGIKRRPFIIIVSVVSILVLATAGIVAGVLVSKGKATASETPQAQPPPSTPTSAISLLQNSSIATTNWTDPAGHMHIYLFFQSDSHDLMASVWDSENKTWATHSPSRDMQDGVTMIPRPGTPIAVVSWVHGTITKTDPFASISTIMPAQPAGIQLSARQAGPESTLQIRVYVTSNDFAVRELNTSDPSLRSGWKSAQQNVTDKASRDTKLAALRPDCGNGGACVRDGPPIAVAFQNASDNYLMVGKGGDTWGFTPVGPAVPGALFGLSTVFTNAATADMDWRIAVQTGDTFLQDYESNKTIEAWDKSTTANDLQSRVEASVTLVSLVTFTFNLVYVMMIALRSDGDLITKYLESDQWYTSQSPPDPPGIEGFKLTAITGNSYKRVYGIANGAIHEWEFTVAGGTKSIISWFYLGQVQ